MSDPDPKGQPSEGHDDGGTPRGDAGPVGSPPDAAAPETQAAAPHDMHDGGHGHDDDHGAGHEHAGEALGPIDVAAWGAGIVGVLLGAVIAVAMAMSTGYITL
jgi:hypothetical protein